MLSEKPPVLEKLLWILFGLTLVSVVVEPWLFNTSLVIKPDSDLRYGIHSDLDVGGSSKIVWLNEEKKEWKCVIREGVDYPYCGYRIYLDDGLKNGLDLSRFDSFNIWISYRGSAETIRLFIRNSNPAYTSPGNEGTTKFHQLEVKPEIFAVPVELKLSSFNVAEWWLRNHHIPLQHAQQDLTNVVSLDISTGTGVRPGDHYFKFHHIILTGRLVSTEQWYLLIIVVWLCMLFIFLVYLMVVRKMSARDRVQQEAELLEINTLLNNRANQLETLAQGEPVTGKMHRVEVEQALRNAVIAHKEKNAPLSIVLMDIDHFMTLSDQLGRDAADKVLVGVSVLVKSNIRENEQFARWGADEFVLVCSGVDNATARKIAEKIRRLVESCDFGIGRHITASFGVASMLEEEGLAELFKRADVALYAAKAVGRNRVCISGETGPSGIE